MPLSRVNTNYNIALFSLPLLVLAFLREWLDYYELWATSYIYTHGFLVFLGTIYLLYQRKEKFKQLPISFSWQYLAIFIGMAFVLLLAHSANIKLARMVLLPFLLIAWGATIWGKPFIKAVGAPILLILFGAPFWDDMSPALQWLTVAVDEQMLALISIPATIDEFYITIPSGIFHVAHGCSGIRYLIVALYLGAFYGAYTHSGPKRTVLLVAVAGFLALLSNWIRVAWIIAAGHYTNMESSLIEDHEMFGWIVFIAVTLIPFFVFTHYFDRIPRKETSTFFYSESDSGELRQRKPLVSATIVLLAIPAILLLQERLAESSANRWKPSLPVANDDAWKGPIRYAGFWNPQYQAHDLHLSGVYVNDDRAQVQLDFYGYNRQGQGKELIYYKNSAFDRELWLPMQERIEETGAENPWGVKKVNQITLTHKFTDAKATVWFWHNIAGSLVTSTSRVQLAGGLNAVLGDQRAGIWILSTECSGEGVTECDVNARRLFQSFLPSISLPGPD